ncbi:hypothetical protein BX600DRAFT_462608 [Xylariales sp. PMI_506]|nr:hypothetical protein BX600DRAFT_462608 [Xylariales sp. PMI_506]
MGNSSQQSGKRTGGRHVDIPCARTACIRGGCPATQHAVEHFNLRTTPYPEPSIEDENLHYTWRAHYQTWRKHTCVCRKGYFCRPHGIWIPGCDLSSVAARELDELGYPSCPNTPDHGGGGQSYSGASSAGLDVTPQYNDGHLGVNFYQQSTEWIPDNAENEGEITQGAANQPQGQGVYSGQGYDEPDQIAQATYFPDTTVVDCTTTGRYGNTELAAMDSKSQHSHDRSKMMIEMADDDTGSHADTISGTYSSHRTVPDISHYASPSDLIGADPTSPGRKQKKPVTSETGSPPTATGSRHRNSRHSRRDSSPKGDKKKSLQYHKDKPQRH